MFRFEGVYKVKVMGEGLMSHVILTNKSKFPEVEYQYGSVKLIEEDDQLRVQFDFEVFANPKNCDTTNSEFRDYIGAILIDIMEQELTYEINLKRK